MSKDEEDLVEFTRLRELGSRSSLGQTETTELHERHVFLDPAGSEEAPVVVKEKADIYYSRPTSPSSPKKQPAEKKESETNRNPVGGASDGKGGDVKEGGSSPNKTSASKTKAAAAADDGEQGRTKTTPSDQRMDASESGQVPGQPFYSLSGRYKPHAPGDEAFSPITLAMSFNTEEIEGSPVRRPTVMIRRPTLESPRSPFSMSDKDQTSGRQAKPEVEKPEPDSNEAEKAKTDDKKEPAPLSSATMQSVVSIMKHLAQVSHVKPESAKSLMVEDDVEALRLSARAIMGLRRWKKRADVRLDMKGQSNYTVDTFARSARHGEALHRNMDELATQLPLPVREMLYAEAFPILEDVVEAYERTLGQSNELTAQARSKLVNMTALMKSLEEL